MASLGSYLLLAAFVVCAYATAASVAGAEPHRGLAAPLGHPPRQPLALVGREPVGQPPLGGPERLHRYENGGLHPADTRWSLARRPRRAVRAAGTPTIGPCRVRR